MLRARAGESSGACSITDFERPVLRDQLAGGLVADPGHARDVVGGVALEADEVGHLLGRDPVAGLDALRRVDVHVGDAARGHHQADVVAAELKRVAVGRDDAGLDPGGIGARRQRRDHVVGLPSFELEVPVAERLDDRPEMRELLAQQVGHRPAALLVDDLCRLGDRGAVHRPRVPRDGDALRAVVREQLEQHVREAEERARRLAVCRGELLGEREEGAVGEIVAVDDEELGLARGRVVQLELGSGQCLRHRAIANGIVLAPMARLEIHPLSGLRDDRLYRAVPRSAPAIPAAGSAIALFCLASVALAVVPGPAVTYIVTQSIDKGRSAGLVSALGVA